MKLSSQATRCCGWVCLVGYALVVSGLPLPLGGPATSGRVDPAAIARLDAKDRSTPFPCMDKSCGCATAEQCFANCCCNTPAETLAWARAHDIHPITLAALERRVDSAQAPPASCCEKTASSTSSCCQSTAAGAASTRAEAPIAPPVATDVCDAYRSLAAAPSHAAAGADSGRGTSGAADIPADAGDDDLPAGTKVTSPRIISLKAMLACGGIVGGWSAAMNSLPPPVAVRCEPAVSLIGSLTILDETHASVIPSIDSPPPRA
jgi:hypothetical protein